MAGVTLDVYGLVVTVSSDWDEVLAAVGIRSLGRTATLEPLPRRSALGPMLREAVVGVGVYQGMEFVLQQGFRDVAGKAGVALTRVRCCSAGLRRARVWKLTLGRDHERNWEALRSLLA